MSNEDLKYPFYVRGNSGRLWKVTGPTEDGRKFTAISVGNNVVEEPELRALELRRMYGEFDESGNQISFGEYSSPQEMYNKEKPEGEPDYSYEHDIIDRPWAAVKADLKEKTQ